MKKKLAKWAVTMLAGAMLALPATGNTVSASGEAKSQVQEETKKIENELNYIYIDEAELDVGAVQSIVLSWGERTSDIRSIDLVVENEDGSRTVLNSQKRVDNLFLYENSFEQGAYHVAELSVTTDLGTKTFTAEDLEINAYFGVGEKVNDSVKSDYIEMESQSGEEAVVTIETANAATVEKNVADALSEQAVPFDKNKKERSNSNLVIVLDPGHDASKHSGATANGVREEVVTLKIAEYCKEVLEQYSSVSVYMTRTDGNCPYPDTNSIDDILKRVEWAKTKDADVFISFHINSSVSGAAQGAEVYYPQGEENAQELAKDIVGELAKLGLKNRGDKGDDSYAVIRHSKRNGFPGLIIEHAFVSNVSDAKWFQTEENLKKLGEADAAGIIKYYGLTKDKGKWEFTGEHWKWKEGNGKYATSTWKSIDGVWYYFDTNSNMTTGWQQIGGIWYYMNSSGAMTTGWQQIGGTWYYMNSSGAMQTGWQQIGGTWYYMNGSGVMQTGWQTIGNQKYYFDGSGAMVTGWQLIDNVWYYFENSGELNNQPSSKPPVNDAIKVYYEIAGDSSVTVEQMVNYYKKSGKPYPAEALKAGGAATIEEFCQIYYEECETEGIKAEVAFIQSMIETGFLQFGGSVKIEQFNFAGLGATGNGVSGNSFENVRMGIRAHVQHLKCYANTEPLKNECVDPRWGAWLRGKAPYVEWLSIPNNPNGTGWAGDADYAAKILKGIQDMKKIEVSMN